MGYTKRIVCLAASLKNGGLCVAGREVAADRFGGWVRPISASDASELSYGQYRYEDYSTPKLLDVIDVPLLGPSPHGHQRENALVDTNRRWVRRGKAAFRRLKDLREEPESLWVNSGSTGYGRWNSIAGDEAREFQWSLCLIEVASLEIGVVRGVRGEMACKAGFEYKGIEYKLSVTDPGIREDFEPRGYGCYPLEVAGEIFLCVSLSEPFGLDGRCHKLVAAVMTASRCGGCDA